MPMKNDREQVNFKYIALFVSIVLAIWLALVMLCGCTISFNTVCSVGEASDVIDEEQTTSPDVKADVTVPMSPI